MSVIVLSPDSFSTAFEMAYAYGVFTHLAKYTGIQKVISNDWLKVTHHTLGEKLVA